MCALSRLAGRKFDILQVTGQKGILVPLCTELSNHFYEIFVNEPKLPPPVIEDDTSLLAIDDCAKDGGPGVV